MKLSAKFAIACFTFPIAFLGSVSSSPAIFPVSQSQELRVQNLQFPQSQTALYSVLGTPHYATGASSWWVLEDGWYIRADRNWWQGGTFNGVSWEAAVL